MFESKISQTEITVWKIGSAAEPSAARQEILDEHTGPAAADPYGSCQFLAKFRQNVARFRLYRHRFLQENTRFAAFFKIYQIIKLNFLKFGKFLQISWQLSKISTS